MSFKDKVILITGASSGIGAASAIYFSRQGATLSLTGRNLENLERTKAACLQEAPKGTPEPFLIQADITQDVVKIVSDTISKFNRINVLINNAGVGACHSIEETSMEEFDYIMNTNLRAVYHLTMLVVPHLIKTQGNIVNVSSLCGLRAIEGEVAYCLSKAALDQFTSCVSLELAGKKVRVNSVNPGIVTGEFQLRRGVSQEEYEDILSHVNSSYPLGRAATPEDVAEAISYLASDERAGYITGVKMPVDGGRQNQCPR